MNMLNKLHKAGEAPSAEAIVTLSYQPYMN